METTVKNAIILIVLLFIWVLAGGQLVQRVNLWAKQANCKPVE